MNENKRNDSIMAQINEKTRNFIACSHVWREFGFNDLAMLTHAWHESGSFKHVIGGFNFWGIKKPQKSPWNGKIADVLTHEFLKALPEETEISAGARIRSKFGGVLRFEKCGAYWKIALHCEFIDFPTIEQAIVWYCGDFIKNKYRDAYMNRTDPETFFKKLVDKTPDYSGDIDLQYATDPFYSTKLISLYKSLSASTDLYSLFPK